MYRSRIKKEASPIEEKDKKSPPRAHIARKNIKMPESRVLNFNLVPIPKDEQEQNKLADELLQWSYLQESHKIEEFAISKHMSPYRFKKICDRNEYFQECYELACYIMATRLQDGVHSKTLDKDLSLQFLPLYHREFREWKIESKQAATAPETGNKIIVIERAASSPLVPERVDEKKEQEE